MQSRREVITAVRRKGEAVRGLRILRREFIAKIY